MPHRPQLFQRLVLPSLLLILLSVIALDWYAARAFRQFHFAQLEQNLEATARLVRLQLTSTVSSTKEETKKTSDSLMPPSGKGDSLFSVSDSIPPARMENKERIGEINLDSLAKQLGRSAGARVTLIARDGKILGDSHEDPVHMDNHTRRPEVAEALRGQTGISERYSATLKQPMLYVAIPFHTIPPNAPDLGGTKGGLSGNALAVIRTAVPLTEAQATLRAINIRIAVGGVVVAIVAAIIILIITRRITQPLAEMKRSAQKFAEGEFSARLHVPETEELASLALAMNSMAAQLDERIRTISRQREEQEAVLAGMIEGVIAVDADEKVFMVNHAAAALFHIDRDKAPGRSIQEVVRNTELQEIVDRAIHSVAPVEDEIILFDPVERVLQISGTSLRSSNGKLQGAVVVMNDITPIRRLERTRRDFVSNASHELKTPITSIKGFVETLRDGAIENRADVDRFLGIIARQADHLTAIVEDLLSLARIERETEHRQIQLEIADLCAVLDEAVALCRPQADAKHQKIIVDCPPDLMANTNRQLLSQAIVNLIDNAIKYSPESTTITVSAKRENDDGIISVADQGHGIPAEHLPRLFERFYRVEKSRNRKHGGTGLGLAIVKHIAAALGGSVDVESTVGKGSRFTIHWPAF